MSFTVRHFWLVTTATIFFISNTQAVSAADDGAAFKLYQSQLKRLHKPSKSQLKREQNDRVYVYVGIKDREVEEALDKHFDRIEHFLFASVIVTDRKGKPVYKNGHIVTESDGC